MALRPKVARQRSLTDDGALTGHRENVAVKEPIMLSPSSLRLWRSIL